MFQKTKLIGDSVDDFCILSIKASYIVRLVKLKHSQFALLGSNVRLRIFPKVPSNWLRYVGNLFMVGMSSGLKYTPGAFQGQCYQIVTLNHVMYQAWLVFRSASARNGTKVLRLIRFGEKKQFSKFV